MKFQLKDISECMRIILLMLHGGEKTTHTTKHRGSKAMKLEKIAWSVLVKRVKRERRYKPPVVKSKISLGM